MDIVGEKSMPYWVDCLLPVRAIPFNGTCLIFASFAGCFRQPREDHDRYYRLTVAPVDGGDSTEALHVAVLHVHTSMSMPH